MECRPWIPLTVWLILFIVSMEKSDALGTIFVQFLKYENPTGLANNGHCCDGKFGVCLSECDNMFEICFDYANGTQSSTEICRLGKFESTYIQNENSNTFAQTIGKKLNNPLRLNAGEIPETFQLKVLVQDQDSINRNELIDFLSQRISLLSPGSSSIYSILARTKLQIEVHYECEPGWYGFRCKVFCKNPSNGDHYECNTTTGAKICNKEWTGSNCSTLIPCINFECHNSGICGFDENLKPICTCPQTFTGLHCELKTCDIYCRPGKCNQILNQNAFTCLCPNPALHGHYVDNGIDETGSPFKCSIETTTASTTTTEKKIIPVSPMPGSYSSDMDCDAEAENGNRYNDGLYNIQPFGDDVFSVWCDMSTEGWTVIQRRYDDGVSFNRNWESYKKPFGDPRPNHSFWIGLEHLYFLTTQRWYTLSITIQMPDGTFKFANYHYFYIENEENGYRLHVYGHDGTAGDALIMSPLGEDRIHNNMKFSTLDKDNDRDETGSCAERYQSGWWFNDCFTANLNGEYKKQTNGWPSCKPNGLCIAWKNTDRFSEFSISSVIMKVKPTDPPSKKIIEAMKGAF